MRQKAHQKVIKNIILVLVLVLVLVLEYERKRKEVRKKEKEERLSLSAQRPPYRSMGTRAENIAAFVPGTQRERKNSKPAKPALVIYASPREYTPNAGLVVLASLTFSPVVAGEKGTRGSFYAARRDRVCLLICPPPSSGLQ